MKFRIYASCGNYGDGDFQCIEEFANENIALNYAREMAFEDLESYDGMHGYPSLSNIAEDWGYDEDDIRTQEIFEEEAESWLCYSVLPCKEGVEYDDSGDPIEDEEEYDDEEDE